MQANVLGTSNDDLFEYAFITSETLEDGLTVIRKAFEEEQVCRALELSKSPEAVKEVEELFARTAKDGISVIAIEKKTGHVVGALFNKLQVKGGDEKSFLADFASKCKCSPSKGIVQFLIDADANIDLFELCEASCLLEMIFLGVLPEYRGRGLGVKLCDCASKITEALLNGDNVKVSLSKDDLPIDPIPQGVCAVFTSFISQKIATKLNFSVASEISYETFIFEGETFGSRMGPSTAPNTVVGYKSYSKN